jgi:hypothetical protein
VGFGGEKMNLDSLIAFKLNTNWKQCLSQVKKALPIMLILFIPFFANVLWWNGFIAPSQNKIKALKDISVLESLQPKLKTLVHESEIALKDWEEKAAIQKDPAAAIKELQKMAQEQHVQIKEIRTEGNAELDHKKSNLPFEKVSVKLQMVGSYHKFARWISAVEAKAAYDIKSWSLKSANPSGEGNQWEVRIELNLKQS